VAGCYDGCYPLMLLTGHVEEEARVACDKRSCKKDPEGLLMADFITNDIEFWISWLS